MRMVRLAIVVVMAMLVAVCNAQAWRREWVAFYYARSSQSEFAAATAPSKDGGGYILTAATNYYDNGYIPLQNGYQLTKVDSGGNAMWSRFLDLEKGGTFKVVEGATGVFVAASVDRMFDGGQSIAVVKYDLFGQQQWMRYYSLAPGYYVQQLVVDSQDDPFLLVQNNPNFAGDWIILRFDTFGNFSWLRHPNFAPNTATTYIATDGGLNLYASGLNDKDIAWLAKYDKYGNSVWSYLESTGVGAQSPPYFAVAPDTTIWFTGAYAYSAGGGITYLRKISSGGQLLSSAHIDYPGLNGVFTDQYGGAYLFPNAPTYTGLPLARFNANGTPVWQKAVLTSPTYDGFCDANGDVNMLEPGQIEQFDSNGNLRWKSATAPQGFSGNSASYDGTGIIAGGANGTVAGIQKLTNGGVVQWSYGNITHDHESALTMYASTSSIGTTYFAGNSKWLGAYDTYSKLLFAIILPRETVRYIQADTGGGVIVGQDLTRKYDDSGNLVWTSSASGNAAAANANGEIYVIGDSLSKVSSAGRILWTLPVSGSTIRLDNYGNVITSGPTVVSPSGTIISRPASSSRGFMEGPGVTEVDSYGNTYVVSNHYTSGTTYGWVRKYSPSGALLWQSDLGTGLNCPMMDAIMDRTSNTLYVASTTHTDHYQPTVWAVDCNANTVKWLNVLNIAANGHSQKILLNPDNHPVVAGDCHDLNSAYDYYVFQLKPTGDLEHLSRFDSGYRMNDRYETFGLDAQGNAYVCGRSIGPSGSYNFNVIKYSIPRFDDAVVTQSAKTKVLAGSQFSVGVTATNIGKDPWTRATGFLVDCLEPNTWGIGFAYLDPGDFVETSEYKQWVVNATAPTTPGTYTMQWQMELAGTKFGLPSTPLTITVAAQTNSGAYISQSVPTSMVSGQTYPVNVQYKNTGSNTWYPSTIRLQSMSPQNNLNWSLARLPLINGPVPPGGIGIFAANLIGPETAGGYSFQWWPIDDSKGLNFGNVSPIVAVQVVAMADAARYLSRTGATTLLAGADFYVQNKMLNVGTNDWLSSGGYNMMTVNPNNDSKWSAIRAYMPAGSLVNTGGPATFTALCSAPITPGTYTMQWQCDKNGVPFGDTTPLLNITVVTSADNAQFLSSTPLPTNIGINATFGVTLTMKNIGTASWNSSYGLAPIGNSSFGVTLIPSGSVAPGGTGTFTGTFTAPATPGTYMFQCRMSHNGTKFGQRSPSVSIIVSPEAGVYVSKNVPATVYAGQDFWIQFTMQNTGSTTWTLSNGYTMMSVNPVNNSTWTINRLYMPSGASIAPGQTVTFSGLATAPITAKTYSMQWQLDRNGVPFGDITPFINVNVVNGPDNAQYVSQFNVATTIQHGAQFDASVTMKNIGTASWGAGYTLVPVGSSNFGIGSIGAQGTAPGGTSTFSQRFTAPLTPGKYTFQWRMAHNGVKFGQPSVAITVTVT